jgi:hypothetical protein
LEKFRETLTQPAALSFSIFGSTNANSTSQDGPKQASAKCERCSMFKLSGKSALLCAVLPIGLLAAGCSSIDGIGSAGFHEVVAGNWPAAKADFQEDYQYAPNHPVAQFNIATAYHHDGDVNAADRMFSQAVISGKTYYPVATLEPEGTAATVGRHACTRLHRDNKLDTNCGDQIAMELPPAPPPAVVAQAEPAPAIEAQATAPKQDRN